MAKRGITSTGKQTGLTRGSLSDWDLFFLGAASKLVATGGTYPVVSPHPAYRPHGVIGHMIGQG